MSDIKFKWLMIGMWLSAALSVITMIVVMYPVSKSDWHCTASVRVGDTLPEQFECVEYSRKETGK